VRTGIDILENELVAQYPDVLEILLRDHTTQKNIFWATNNYEHLGSQYNSHVYILSELITGENGNIVMPRVHKDKVLQQSRSKEMAEVFTPSWICNAQNNLIDNAWFGKEGVFNQEKTLSALQVVKEHEFTRTLILTHRPLVDKGWFEDFGKIFYEPETKFNYGSKNKGNQFTTLETSIGANPFQKFNNNFTKSIT
jgi:hypothetical protein